jgi:hypothetical protein
MVVAAVNEFLRLPLAKSIHPPSYAVLVISERMSARGAAAHRFVLLRHLRRR